MGLMMSVLVFSIGVLEAMACVEHVRQSYLPLDLGRKRRRLVLDVGSGTIRHRETRRSSEFQRDPHVFLRSIQAAVEEEGDEKESEELAAIFQSVETHNIHSTQMINHQDPLFLTVNDIEDSDSCASRTSTPNTVIMNMSPELDRGAIVEPSYIPSDSYSENSGLKIDEVFSNQKDINIAQVDIGKFMCIREQETPLESTISNEPNVSETLQASITQYKSEDKPDSTINLEFSAEEKLKIIEESDSFTTVDVQDSNMIPISGIENSEEKSKDSHFTNANNLFSKNINPKTDANEFMDAIVVGMELSNTNFEIGTKPDSVSSEERGKDVGNNTIDKSICNIQSNTSSVDDNKVNLEPCDISRHTDENMKQDNELEINRINNEKSSTKTNIPFVESNNRETIEKCETLVKSQVHSEKDPLIENKAKDEIFEAQLEQVIDTGKQSQEYEIHRPTEITDSVNVMHVAIKNEKEQKGIHSINQLHSTSVLSGPQCLETTSKIENEPLKVELLMNSAQLNESEKSSTKLVGRKDKFNEVEIASAFNDDPSSNQILDKTETISDSKTKCLEKNKDDFEFQVDQKRQLDAVDSTSTSTDVSCEINKTIDQQTLDNKTEVDKETRTDSNVEANTIDSMSISVDNNSNVVKETCSVPDEKKTLLKTAQVNQKVLTPDTLETVGEEHALVPSGKLMVAVSNEPKEQKVTSEQNFASDDIVSIDSRSRKVEKEEECVRNDALENKFVKVESEHDIIQLNDQNVNAYQEHESREVLTSEETSNEALHSANISEDVVDVKDEFGSDKVEPVIKSKIVEECVRHLTDVVSEEQKLASKSDVNDVNTYRYDSEEPPVIMEEIKPQDQLIPKSIELKQEHQVDSREKIGSEIIVSKDIKLEAVDTDTRHSINDTVSNETIGQEEAISSKIEVNKTEKMQSAPPKTSKPKIKTGSNEEITSKDLIDVKESLKPLPQKGPADDKGGKPSDEKAVQKDKGVLAKQETLSVSPFPDDVTVLVGDRPSQNQFTPVEDITSPDKAFWLIFSGEYTKAMSKDWHSGHFCCWQCDESLTGQRYVLRDDHPYCIKCYEQVFANTCDECSKVIGIDSKDLSYKDKHWHEACFLCSKCRVSLVDKQFGSKADKIYCGNCYDAQFASRCDGCGQIFRAGTKKMEYKTRQWHEQCFCCCVCKTAIGTKSFIPREQEIYCATCYEEKFATRCVKCNKIITSGGVTYKNEPWHRECFTCTNCSTSLAGQRFTSRDEKPYCAECFGELFAKRCTACCKPITGIGGTRFISFEDRHWHNDCFICASCRSSLVGRGFITDAEDILCTECAKQKLM